LRSFLFDFDLSPRAWPPRSPLGPKKWERKEIRSIAKRKIRSRQEQSRIKKYKKKDPSTDQMEATADGQAKAASDNGACPPPSFPGKRGQLWCFMMFCLLFD
jgi:hypothetical protein